MSRFALIGAAGYVAPRHMNAIKTTGHDLVAALDRNDTVGVLDGYFPDARFFTEFERFDRYVDLLRRRGEPVEYVTIASPNYLHDSHIRFALRAGTTAICEKPLVVNPWNAEALRDIEAESGQRVFTILQLRLHPSIVALRERIAERRKSGGPPVELELTYVTSRGNWYFASWKGEERKSGGIVANIGIHFFDMLVWIFGPVAQSEVTFVRPDCAAGLLHFEHARVPWFLSVNPNHLPEEVRAKGQRTFRSVTLEGEDIEFSEGFTDLHTQSYQRILAGEGFTIEDALPSIRLVHDIRSAAPSGPTAGTHPLARAIA